MMKLDIKEMIDGNPARLRFTYRYSTSRVQVPESVAEHSFFVSFYCLWIGEWVVEHYKVKSGMPSVHMGVLLRRALLHDLEEARSGDVPRPFKYSDPELRRFLEKASEMAFKQVLEPMIGGGSVQFDDALDSWKNSKDDTLEGRILDFADFLSVVGFLLQEQDAGANKLVKRHVADITAYYQRFVDPAFDFIRSLVLQAEKLVQEIERGT